MADPEGRSVIPAFTGMTGGADASHGAGASYVPGACQARASYVPATCQLRASYVPATCQLRASYVPATCQLRSWYQGPRTAGISGRDVQVCGYCVVWAHYTLGEPLMKIKTGQM